MPRARHSSHSKEGKRKDQLRRHCRRVRPDGGGPATWSWAAVLLAKRATATATARATVRVESAMILSPSRKRWAVVVGGGEMCRCAFYGGAGARSGGSGGQGLYFPVRRRYLCPDVCPCGHLVVVVGRKPTLLPRSRWLQRLLLRQLHFGVSCCSSSGRL